MHALEISFSKLAWCRYAIESPRLAPVWARSRNSCSPICRTISLMPLKLPGGGPSGGSSLTGGTLSSLGKKNEGYQIDAGRWPSNTLAGIPSGALLDWRQQPLEVGQRAFHAFSDHALEKKDNEWRGAWAEKQAILRALEEVSRRAHVRSMPLDMPRTCITVALLSHPCM